MGNNLKKYNDTLTMTKRCLLISKRNPDTFLSSIMLPALMMFLFVSLFGKIVNMEETSYVNYIVPGILLQCVGQCSSATAILMNKDMTNGMVNRFCTLPIRRLSILNGHIIAAIVRNLITSVVVFIVAMILGFRPATDLLNWGIILLLLVGIILALSWFAVVGGIVSNSAEGASSIAVVMALLPYLSSGFVPVEAMPKALSLFAKYQPMTPIIDTMRNALLGNPLDVKTFIIALIWCIGLVILFYVLSLALFNKRISK